MKTVLSFLGATLLAWFLIWAIHRRRAAAAAEPQLPAFSSIVCGFRSQRIADAGPFVPRLRLLFLAWLVSVLLAIIYGGLVPLYMDATDLYDCRYALVPTLAYLEPTGWWTFVTAVAAGTLAPVAVIGLFLGLGRQTGLVVLSLRDLADYKAKSTHRPVVRGFGQALVVVFVTLVVLAIMLVVNAGYVFLQDWDRLPETAKKFLPLGLTLVSLAIDIVLVPAAVNLVVKTRSSLERSVPVIFNMIAGLQLANNMLVPLIGVLLFGPECFRYKLFPPPSEVITFSDSYCSEQVGAADSSGAVPCSRFTTNVFSIPVRARFAVDARCLSSLIEFYFVANVFKILIDTCISPLLGLAKKWIPHWASRLLASCSRCCVALGGCASGCRRRCKCCSKAATEKKVEAGEELHHLRLESIEESMSLLTITSIALTYGFAAPPLAIVSFLALSISLLTRWLEWTPALQRKPAAFVPIPLSVLLLLLSVHSVAVLAYFFLGDFPGRFALAIQLAFVWIGVAIAVLVLRHRKRRSATVDLPLDTFQTAAGSSLDDPNQPGFVNTSNEGDEAPFFLD